MASLRNNPLRAKVSRCRSDFNFFEAFFLATSQNSLVNRLCSMRTTTSAAPSSPMMTRPPDPICLCRSQLLATLYVYWSVTCIALEMMEGGERHHAQIVSQLHFYKKYAQNQYYDNRNCSSGSHLY